MALSTGAKVVLGGASVLGLYYLLKPAGKKASTPGDSAQTGDQVWVPLAAFSPGALPAALTGTVDGAPSQYLVITVTDTLHDTVDGMIVGVVGQTSPTVQIATLATPIGPIRIDRTMIAQVYRNQSRVA